MLSARRPFCYLLNVNRSSIYAQIFYFLRHALSTRSADVVVCGGGISGTSIAYHLAKRGKKVLLLERDMIGSSGATGVSVGCVTAPMHWQDATKQYMAKSSLDLYKQLASTSSFMYLASSVASEVSLRRMFSRSVIYDEGAELLENTSEISYRWPYLRSNDITLALFSPNDVFLDAVGLCQALVEQAKEMGVKVREHCSVQEVILDKNNVVSRVDTDMGFIETNTFVDATGIMCGHIPVRNLLTETFRIAVYPATFAFLSTQGVATEKIDHKSPIFTNVDEKTFIKFSPSTTYCGGFSKKQVLPLPLPESDQFKWEIPAGDWDLFYPSLSKVLNRCQLLKSLEHGNIVNGAEAYTPDKYPVVGEIPQVSGYYVTSGLNGHGLAMAGGIGEVLADIICKKTSKVDLSRMEPTRFLPLHSNPQYLFERVPEVAGMLFTNSYEYHQFHTARNLRTSPIFHSLKEQGAVFGEVMGYERPLWYSKQSDSDNLYKGQYKLIGKPEWFDRVAQEYEACRERVGLIDLSSFSKFDVFGPDAVKLLQLVCSADIDGHVGTTLYSGMQDSYGGYVTDCSLNRLNRNHYFIIAPTIQQLRLKRWIEKWKDEYGFQVTCQDVTGFYTALGIIGPASRYLMQDLTGLPMTSSTFPTFRIKEINIGITTGIRAISVSHCGELGWVLYIPSEVAQNVYERLVESGEEYSLKHAGYYALRGLRIEKFYVYWGQDINPLVTPLECGREFRVNFKKKFIGREALMKQKKSGVTKRFVQVLVQSHDLETDPWPQGGEVIFRNEQPVGRTTSAAYAFTLACQVCIGYIKSTDSRPISMEYLQNGNYHIEIAGKMFPARINLHSPSLPMISSEHPMHYLPTR